MNGRVAKKLRRKVYGKGHHPGPVTYYQHNKISTTRVSDPERWNYQQMKEQYKRTGVI